MSAERDLERITNCTDDEKREILHSFSKERLVELVVRLSRDKE